MSLEAIVCWYFLCWSLILGSFYLFERRCGLHHNEVWPVIKRLLAGLVGVGVAFYIYIQIISV